MVYLRESPVLPTNTTCTDEKAAVAAKFSTLLAAVKMAKLLENKKENTMMAPNRTSRLFRKYKTKIDTAGRREEIMTLRTCAALTNLDSL